jgi:hypothetical protein
MLYKVLQVGEVLRVCIGKDVHHKGLGWLLLRLLLVASLQWVGVMLGLVHLYLVRHPVGLALLLVAQLRLQAVQLMWAMAV